MQLVKKQSDLSNNEKMRMIYLPCPKMNNFKFENCKELDSVFWDKKCMYVCMYIFLSKIIKGHIKILFQ